MNIVRVANGDYDRYEELLLRHEQLRKTAYEYQLDYMREFGELSIKLFQLKMDCIALKKSISFCVSALNKGETPDETALYDYLAKAMIAYQNQLDDMIKEHKEAKEATFVSPYDVSEIKKIYRRIAKLLHPDISPLTNEYPELFDLFQRVMVAYHCNNLKELQSLEVLINSVLRDNGIENVSMVIPNISGRIAELEAEIETIITTEPYIYKDLLSNAFRVQEKKDNLNKEISEYETYKSQLKEQLNSLFGGV